MKQIIFKEEISELKKQILIKSIILQVKLENLKIINFILNLENILTIRFPLVDKEWNKCKVVVKKSNKEFIIYRYNSKLKNYSIKWSLNYKTYQKDWIIIYQIEEIETKIQWEWLWTLLIKEFHKMIWISPSFVEDWRKKEYLNKNGFYEQNWYTKVKTVHLLKDDDDVLIRWNINEILIKKCLSE